MGSEDARIARLSKRYASDRLGVRVGIGDDAAVLEAEEASTVVSVDACVEGVHFRRAWLQRGLTLETLGARATVAALSDLAAMGAAPRAIVSSLILPDWMDDAALDGLCEGIASAAKRYLAPVVGGNLSRGGELSINTTVIGAADEVITRSGARAGDHLYVTGCLGAAALGWRAIDAGRAGEAPLSKVVERWLHPRAHIAVGARLVGTASAAIDVSDGLLKDLRRLCTASGVGARIEADLLPKEDSHEEACQALGLDPLRVLLSGGEDYELLFAAPVALLGDELATRIGYVSADLGVVLVDAQGAAIQTPVDGFDHFSVR